MNASSKITALAVCNFGQRFSVVSSKYPGHARGYLLFMHIIKVSLGVNMNKIFLGLTALAFSSVASAYTLSNETGDTYEYVFTSNQSEIYELAPGSSVTLEPMAQIFISEGIGNEAIDGSTADYQLLSNNGHNIDVVHGNRFSDMQIALPEDLISEEDTVFRLLKMADIDGSVKFLDINYHIKDSGVIYGNVFP